MFQLSDLSVPDVPDVDAFVLVKRDGLTFGHNLHLHRRDVVHRALIKIGLSKGLNLCQTLKTLMIGFTWLIHHETQVSFFFYSK